MSLSRLKRSLCILLSVMMVSGLLPAYVFANAENINETLAAGQDAVIDSQSATTKDTNYDDRTAGASTPGNYNIKRAGAWSRMAYYQFDVDNAADVIAAEFSIVGKLNAGQTGSVTFSVYGITHDAWNETTITWNHQSANHDEQYGNITGVGETAFYLGQFTVLAAETSNLRYRVASPELTEFVRTHGTDGKATFIVADLEGANLNSTMLSKETSNANNRPWLALTKTPPAPSETVAVRLPIVAVAASENDGNVEANTLDNKLYTRWSAQGDGQWVQYDLGEEKAVGYVGVAFYNGTTRTSTFSIEVSGDAQQWTRVLDHAASSGVSNHVQAFEIPDSAARYIRYVGHGNSANDWNSITEFQAYAPHSRLELITDDIEESEPPPPVTEYTKPGLYEPSGSPYTVHTPNPVTGVTRSVVDYGAVPDDDQDDAAAIRAALAAAQAGDEVYLPNGTYRLLTTMPNDAATHFELKNGVNIRGESQDGVMLLSAFDDGTPGGLSHASSRVVKAFNKNNIRISNMTFSSTWNGMYPTDPTTTSPHRGGPKTVIYIDDNGGIGSNHMTIDHVTIEKFEKMAIRISESNRIVVTNSIFRNATDVGGGGAGYGISIQGTPKEHRLGFPNDTYFNLVENNRFEGPYLRHGTLIQYYAHNNTVRNNTFTNLVYDSIDLHGEDEYMNEIYANTISGISRGGGIGVGNTGGTLASRTNHDAAGPFNYIHDNVISNSREGIRIYMGSPDTLVENNIIENMTQENAAGIILENAPRTILKNNILRNSTGENYWAVVMQYHAGDTNPDMLGAGAGRPEDVQLIGNRIVDNTNGIRIDDAVGTILQGNTLNNPGVDLYVADGVTIREKPSDDAAIDRGTPDTVSTSHNWNVKVVESGNTARLGYLKFPVSNAVAVGEARLKLSAKLGSGTTEAAFDIYGLTDDNWSEDTITWNNSTNHVANPAIEPGIVTGVPDTAVLVGSFTVTSAAELQHFTADVTGFVRSQADGQATFLIAPASRNNGNVNIYSKERSNAAEHPHLALTYGVSGGTDPDPDPVTVTSIAASDDTHVRSSGTNYGADASINIKKTSAENRRAYLKFVLPEPMEGAIDEAVVKLYVTALESATLNSPEKGYFIRFYGLEDDNWDEDTLVYTNQPTAEGLELGQVFVGEDQQGTYISLDVAGFVRTQRDGVISFYIEGVNQSRGANYASKENSLDRPPMLVMTTRQATLPAAAPDLAATAGNAEVALAWTAVSGALAYIVKRSDSAEGPFVPVVSDLVDTTFTDTELTNGVTYYYVVHAANQAGEGPPSQTVHASPAFPLQLANPVFTDFLGSVQSRLQGDTFLRAEVDIVNLTDEARPGLLIVALFGADHSIARIAYAESRVGAGATETFSGGFTLPTATGGYDVKVFVLDSMENGKRLSDELRFE